MNNKHKLNSKPTYQELEQQVGLLNSKISNLISYQNSHQSRENIYQKVLDAVPAFIFWKDKSNNLLGFNQAYEKAVNIPREELLSKTGFELFPDAEKYWVDDLEVMNTGVPKLNIVEEVIIPPNKQIWFKTDKVPLWSEKGEIIGVIGVSIDITELKNAQDKLFATNEKLRKTQEELQQLNADLDLKVKQSTEELRESEERYRGVVEQAVVGIAQTDLQGRFLFVNDHYCAIVGRRREELLSGMRMQDITDKEDLPANMQLLQRLVEQGIGFTIEKRYVRPDDSRIWVGNEVGLIYSTDGQPLYMQTITQDITERKQAEAALQKEKQTVQRYLDIAASIFVVLDSVGKVVLLNRKGSQILGYTEEEVIGKDWFELFIPDDEKERVREVFKEMMQGKIKLVEYFENSVLTKNQQERLIEWHNAILYDEQGQPAAALSSGVDITEKRKAEQDVMKALIEGQEAERERVAKELHEGLGQYLTAMQLNLNALQSRFQHDDPEAGKLFDQLKAILHDTTQDIKAISKNLMPEVLRKYGIVEGLEYLCKSYNGTQLVKIDLQVYHMDKKLDATQSMGLYRIAQELINNALRHGKATEIHIQLMGHQESVVLMVEDNGTGFEQAVIQTKNGFGLKNIESRVKALSGSFLIDSHPGQGASVTVEIPL